MLMRRIADGMMAGLAALSLAGCGVTSFALPGPPVAEAQYSALYPTYAEVCAVSQINKIPGFGADLRGGVGGHSVLYLSGACLDGSGYPSLRRCTAQDADGGVGISANAHFRNANWVAIPGRDLFLHGDLPAGARLTKAAYERTQETAKRLGLYDGIQFYPEYFDDKPADVSQRDWKYEISVATDYAIDFGRGRYCGRVPVSSHQLDQMIAFLNARNAVYRYGKQDFEWNVLQDNCSHLTHNALAAAGIWPQWPIEQFVLFAAFDFPVPKNEFINLMRKTNDSDLTDLPRLYADPATRAQILAGTWRGDRPGALAEAAPARKPNDLYRTDLQLIFYDEAITGRYERALERIEAAPRYRDIGANLHYFDAQYRQIEANRRPLADWRAADPWLADAPGFSAFYTRYYAAIAADRADTEHGLAKLAALGQ